MSDLYPWKCDPSHVTDRERLIHLLAADGNALQICEYSKDCLRWNLVDQRARATAARMYNKADTGRGAYMPGAFRLWIHDHLYINMNATLSDVPF